VKTVPIQKEKDIPHVLWEDGKSLNKWRPWPAIVDDVRAMSARHNLDNKGFPLLDHVCLPKEKTCVDAIRLFIEGDGQWHWFTVSTHKDPTGQTTSNEVCWFNLTSDVRNCMDYGATADGPIEMKGSDGHWEIVESAEKPSSDKEI
jgi:hypothetical protein